MWIAAGHLLSLKPHYASAEESLALTSFGFEKPDATWMEVCIERAEDIRLTYGLARREASWSNRLLESRTRDHEESLRSREALHASIRRFFTSSDEELEDALQRAGRA